MSPASKSKSKDKKASKTSPKSSSHASLSGHNPLLGTFHILDSAHASSNGQTLVNDRFRNIDETDDHIGNVAEYDSVSNNGSWSGESEDHKEKEKTPHPTPRQETVPGADNEKREKIRQKNERKHQRQKERRAQELRERCSGFLMSRKVEALARQLVAMGFSQDRATMALILNEGRVEESVAWLFEGGEEADEQKEHKGGNNLKIDISEELARITALELKFKCSKQDVERAVVACEGDLEKAEETLRAQKQEPSPVPPKPEENGDPPTTKLPISGSQSSLRAAPKPTSSTAPQQKRDEKDFNYTKVASLDTQTLKKVQPKMEWAKPPQIIVPGDNRWVGSGSNPNPPYSLSSSATTSAKTEAQYTAIGNEFKNLQLGNVREPVIMMQRPQSINAKQTQTLSISSSPPGNNAAGWYPNSFEPKNPNAVSRSLNSNAVSTNQLYNQLHYPQQQQHVSSYIESSGTNSLWSRTGTSPPQALAAASLGLFSGLGTNSPPGSSSSPVDWNNGCSMPQFDYTNIDWSLDCGSSSRSAGQWPSMNSYIQNNARAYDSFTSARPVSFPRLQDGVGVAEPSGTGGLLDWTSPFEEKDLFSLSRQFVYSPSL